jgi:hypothetical protein
MSSKLLDILSMIEWLRKRFAYSSRPIAAIILATILVFQASALSQFGITGKNSIDNAVKADHGLNPMPDYIDPKTCELAPAPGKVVREMYKAGYLAGRSSGSVWPPPEIPPPIF